MVQCVNCGAYFVNEDKLIKRKKEYFDLAPKGKEIEKVDASYDYYICSRCGEENFVTTNQ